ncbi:hypothetical protein CI109_101478 [Kwoniella shandongensis]|uniref:Uncharacterized protein n=1 Tax=Kwoniella shandongensis TaxID=1734106 RepID=A0A5M6C7S4_9TREE|nr:uncharacterized protein CI109_001930 [Kwoniella shandongensis]KAA5529505.1 hypothetical protein CI109_001930 [Kwoniella shandongensis]
MARLTILLITLISFFLLTCQAAPTLTPAPTAIAGAGAEPAPTHTIVYVPRYRAGAMQPRGELPKTKHLDRMSNAQRIRQGLPLRKPGHVFDARLGPRAPAPSGA